MGREIGVTSFTQTHNTHTHSLRNLSLSLHVTIIKLTVITIASLNIIEGNGDFFKHFVL